MSWHPPPKLAVQERSVPGDSFTSKLQTLEKCGYQAIELVYDLSRERPQEIASALAASPIEAISMCTSAEHDLGTVGTDLRQRISAFREILDFARQFGVRYVVSVPVRGPLEKGGTEEEEIDQYVQALQVVGEHAASLGSCVVIEPLVRYETHLVNRLSEAVTIAKSVDSPAVGIMADFFHMNVEEADIATSILEAGPWIKHVHLADSNRLNPGRGHTDFRRPFEALKSAGFSGAMALECSLAEGPEVTELSYSAAYLQALLT